MIIIHPLNWLWDKVKRALRVDDAVFVGPRKGTIGAWAGDGRTYKIGSVVPHSARGHSTYSIQTRQGWWISVVQGRIETWSRRPIHPTVLDADGAVWKGEPGSDRYPRDAG